MEQQQESREFKGDCQKCGQSRHKAADYPTKDKIEGTNKSIDSQGNADQFKNHTRIIKAKLTKISLKIFSVHQPWKYSGQAKVLNGNLNEDKVEGL
jgi:hypothetical protein